MAKKKYGGTRRTRNIERELVQNQQAYLTTMSADTLYTADDMVTLKRIIVDLAAVCAAATNGGHAIGGLWLIRKDMSNPTLVATDGEIVAAANCLLAWPYQWDATSDGMFPITKFYDAKFSRKLQPGDKIVLLRVATQDTGIMAEKGIFQMFFEH